MRIRWSLGALVVLTLAATPVVEALPYCGEIMCYVPPRAHCGEQCLECSGGDSGTDYQGPFGSTGTCDQPEVITVTNDGCPCLQGAFPDLGLAGGPAILPVPALPLTVPPSEVPAAPAKSPGSPGATVVP